MLRFTLIFVLVLLLKTVSDDASALETNDSEELKKILIQVEDDLHFNVLPFWKKTWDGDGRGFNTVIDNDGHAKSTEHVNYLVMQARIVWTFSAAHRYGIHDPDYLELAKKGMKYIITHMWDPVNGGFYMAVDSKGIPVDTHKYTYAHEFVILALSEYARASNDRNALRWAEKTYRLIKKKAADGQEGFHEDFDREWNPEKYSLAFGGVLSGKTLNTHLHMMEALTALVQVLPKKEYIEDLAQITDMLIKKTIHPGCRCAMEPFDAQWNPLMDSSGRLSTYYGHNVEFAWLLLDAYHALGRPQNDILPVFLGLIDNALAFGTDAHGSLVKLGPYTQKAVTDARYTNDIRDREWWVQSEALVAYLQAYRLTQKSDYLNAFKQQWHWIGEQDDTDPFRL